MERRRLIGMLGLAPLFAAVAARLAPASDNRAILSDAEGHSVKIGTNGRLENNHQEGDSFIYKGYSVIWTGWKSDQSRPDLVAQWVAFWTRRHNALYVSNPGGWGSLPRGSHCWTGWRWPQILTSIDTPIPVFDMVKAEMRLALLSLIDFSTEHGLQEKQSIDWPGMPSVHPQEFPDYDGWKRFTPEQIADIRNEERLAKQQKAEAMPGVFGFTPFINR